MSKFHVGDKVNYIFWREKGQGIVLVEPGDDLGPLKLHFKKPYPESKAIFYFVSRTPNIEMPYTTESPGVNCYLCTESELELVNAQPF